MEIHLDLKFFKKGVIILENQRVYLNVNESDIFYRFQNFKFYFSSVATRERFIKKCNNFIEEEKMKFINKYDVGLEDDSFDLLFAFILYHKTEKRGFKVEQYIEDKKFRTLSELPKFRIWR